MKDVNEGTESQRISSDLDPINALKKTQVDGVGIAYYQSFARTVAQFPFPFPTQVLIDNYVEAYQWLMIINKTLSALQAKKQDTIWPRDTLFKYLKTMEELQENMKEYNDLRHLAACSLIEIYDH